MRGKKLNRYQREQLDEALAHMFFDGWRELAEEMGLVWPLSAADEARLNAEFDRRHEPTARAHLFDEPLAEQTCISHENVRLIALRKGQRNE